MNTYRVFAVLLMGVVCISQAAPADLLSASKTFIDSLDEEAKSEAVFAFNSEERLNWHFIPKQRLGPSLNDLSAAQDKLLLKLVESGLSQSGYAKAETIRSLEGVLREMENSQMRDTENYHILFFGEPSSNGDWTVRYEGHHLSFNWTFVNGELVSSSPQFLGANPAEVRIEGSMKGTRVLAAEEDLARELVTSLTADQKSLAILGGKVPRDIFTSAQQKAERQDDVGIGHDLLDERQQGLLLSIIDESARVQPPSVAKYRLDKIREACLCEVKFAWLGSTEKGQAHYYRIQGPTFLIEYDNIQNDVNHIHVVWRDFEGDFGVDMLKEHHTRFSDPDRPGVHDH